MANLDITLKVAREIKEDCDKLKKVGDLTEYGEGQLGIVNLILKK